MTGGHDSGGGGGAAHINGGSASAKCETVKYVSQELKSEAKSRGRPKEFRPKPKELILRMTILAESRN